MARPIVVITPGSFSPASEYDSLISELAGSGYEAFAYDLPTTRKKPSDNLPASTLHEDSAFFNGVLSGLCDQSQNVVILGHSYGGMVISEAVKGLTQKRVGKGRVLGMIYLTAAAAKEGQSTGEMTTAAGLDLNFIKVDGEFMSIGDMEACARTNFSDLPLEKGIECSKRFSNHSAPSFGNALQYAGYKDADNVAYLFCTEDKTLPPTFQQQSIDNINESRKGKRGEVKVYELPTSHCPHASAPVDVARLIVEAIKAFE